MRNNNLTMLGAVALALMISVVVPSSTWANVTRVFDLSGIFGDGNALTGDVTMDVTVGDATAIDVTADSFPFSSIGSQSSQGATYTIFSVNASNQAHLTLVFPVASLVGYNGGALSTNTHLDDLLNIPATATYLMSGSATLVSSSGSVPELSTWAMMLLGFAGLGGYAAFRTSNKKVASAV
jgi:hypothetical protein